MPLVVLSFSALKQKPHTLCAFTFALKRNGRKGGEKSWPTLSAPSPAKQKEECWLEDRSPGLWVQLWNTTRQSQALPKYQLPHQLNTRCLEWIISKIPLSTGIHSIPGVTHWVRPMERRAFLLLTSQLGNHELVLRRIWELPILKTEGEKPYRNHSRSKTKNERDLACHRAKAIEMTVLDLNLSIGYITI